MTNKITKIIKKPIKIIKILNKNTEIFEIRDSQKLQKTIKLKTNNIIILYKLIKLNKTKLNPLINEITIDKLLSIIQNKLTKNQLKYIIKIAINLPV